VTVQRIESSNPPHGAPGFPQSAGNGCPLYLSITATGLPNNSFNVTVVIDVSNIPGFNPNTKVMYYNTEHNMWEGVEGVYSPPAKTFTFSTTHFTDFGFVNPLNPNELYIAQSNTDPANTRSWYPAVGMGDPATPPDWKYSNAKATFFVVPTGTAGMYASEFIISWDKSKATLLSSDVTMGNYWDLQYFQGNDISVGNNGKYIINITNLELTNPVPASGKYLAKLEFTNIKPGFMPVAVEGTDFRYYENESAQQQSVYVTANPGKIKFYLGDFAKSTTDQTIGDGKINFADVNFFTPAYWSVNGTHATYKFKFDVGPTNASGNYWALPTPDGRIEFEDLVIFSIGYGKTGGGQLPDNPGKDKMLISTLPTKYENGYMKVPVKVSGVVRDFRAGSFEFSYSSSELDFAGFERKGGFEGDDNFMLSKTENNKIMLDAAIVGSEKDGMNGEQVIMNLLFTE
ncbi:MAG: hypothetical protein L0Y76_02975, partial [Ignavibacteria bacterium]|nr:hypothetical protein [Ignavibacteria bacterium]